MESMGVMGIMLVGVLAVAQTNLLPPPPTAPTVKHYLSVRVTNQAAQLTTRVMAVTNKTVSLSAEMLANNAIEYTTNLTSGHWTTVATFSWPIFQTNLPAQGQAGFWRLNTTWAGGSILSTNQITP